MERKVVFVSHSKKDINRVNTLLDELRAGKFEVTRSSHKDDLNMSHLERACVFVVCLSVDYCTEDACHNEFLMLHWQEKPLIPVVLDSVSWPPGDNLFIHRDYFWNLTALMVDLSAGGEKGSSREQLVTSLNTALGITDDEKDDSWRVGSPRKSAPSPAALSASQQRAKDDEIMMQLAMQSAEYQKLASAPPSVSGRARTRSRVNSIDQSVTDSRHRSAVSGRQPSSSRRSSLLTVTTVEELSNDRKDDTDNHPEAEVNSAEPKTSSEAIETERRVVTAGTNESQASTDIKATVVTNSVEANPDIPSKRHDKHETKGTQKLKRRPSGGAKKSKSCSIL